MKTFLCSFICLKLLISSKASEPIDSSYFKVYEQLDSMLAGKRPPIFKEAVFLTENTYLQQTLNYRIFNEYIYKLVAIAQAWSQFNHLKQYNFSDSLNVQKNFSLYKLLKDTINISVAEDGYYIHFPYTYDFNDFFGEKEWSNMFVTKLMASHSGNCHSLPYLYKILADELGATCWLSLAPNHMYIKNRCKQIGWYNTELTSGDFPIDAWIMASGYLPIQAVQSGIYMDTLSNQQAIALCVLDLAKGYEHQTKNYDDGFILKCCDLSLQYFPLNVQAMLLKAETLKRIYEKQKAAKDETANSTYNEMENIYAKIFDLGYREMPEKMYLQWLGDITTDRKKYENKPLKDAIK